MTDNSTVIVANKFDHETIVEQLRTQYGKRDIVIFDVKKELVSSDSLENFENKNALSIRFSGGLGNQMFQYALYRAIRENGKNIFVRNMNGSGTLEISRVFNNIRIEQITKEDEDNIVNYNVGNDIPNNIFSIYRENMTQGTVKRADEGILNIDSGIINGVFQTRLFAERTKDSLIKEFAFPKNDNKMLNSFLAEFRNNDSVSVHIRMGDYLVGNNKYIYGDICNEDYYKKAFEYLESNVDKPVFYVFSNDIDEAKHLIKGFHVRYIDSKEFDEYEDWFDMYMMSQCKHNIIANSTFSWWGAWLNENPDKIVIAPKAWSYDKAFSHEDMIPEEWNIF